MAHTTLANMFLPMNTESVRITMSIPIICKIDLELDTFNPGDIIRGNFTISHQIPFKTIGFLIVVDGTIKAILPDENISSRRFKDSITNLHIFTYLVGDGRKNAKFPAGIQVYPFAITLPLTNLPGSFTGTYGTIEYKVKAILDIGYIIGAGMYVYKTMAEQEIYINSYFNVNRLKSVRELGRKSWQMRKTDILADIISSSIKILKGAYGSEVIQLSNKLSKPKKLSFVLTLPASIYVQGDKLKFLLNCENRMGESIDKIEISLIFKTIFTVWSSKTITKVLTTINKSEIGLDSTIIWDGEMDVPVIKMASSVCVQNELIIFQYFVRVSVWVNGNVVLSGECLIGIGTHRLSNVETEAEKKLQRKLILNLEKCKYPIGFSEMSRPENWDAMYNTGRIGYCVNKTSQMAQEICAPYMSDCVSICSFVSCSTSKSKPPNYSALSSRRTSISTLPPTYDEQTELS